LRRRNPSFLILDGALRVDRRQETRSMTVRIRRAITSDAPAIAALWLAMMREHREFEPRVQLSNLAQSSYLEYARRHCQEKDSVVLVAEPDAGAAIVGFALAYKVRNLPMFLPEYYGFVSDAAVAAQIRGQGIGRRMVEQTCAALRHMGAAHVQLQFYIANQAGGRFWRRMGFEDYVAGMWKDL